MATPAGDFRVEKTYLDVVSPEGDVAIAYDLAVRWGRLRLAAGSVLFAPRGAAPVARTAIGARPLRAASAGGWTFASSRLGALGRWEEGRRSTAARTLHEEGSRSVRWTSLATSVAAEFSFGGRRLEGLGYVERLELDLEPWRLPLGILRWGRFIADAGDADATWISWRDAADRRSSLELAIVDGEPVEDPEASPRRVAWRGGSVEVDRGRPLRDAPLASGPVALVARVLPGLPGRWLRAHETKWLSRGMRLGAAAMPRAGWIVHEEVRFPPVA